MSNGQPPIPVCDPSPGGRAAARPLSVWLAGRIGFADYCRLAERLAWEVSEPQGRCPTLLLCELEPAITVGRLGSRADVLLSDDELRERRLAVRFVGRGGGAVLHAPGQVFVALFATLTDLGLGSHDVGAYLTRFEGAIEAALRQVRCGTVRHPGVPGIFGRTGLLAAVGVAVRRGVASHGGFVNVAPALEAFEAVHSVPAGFAAQPRTMGSVEADLQRPVRLQDVRTALVQQFGDLFRFPRSHIQSGFPLPVSPPFPSAPEVFSRVG